MAYTRVRPQVNRPEVMIGNAAQRFDAEGNLTDEASKDYIRQLLGNLAELVERIRQPSISVPISDSRRLVAASTT